jgi:hypothetical protein
MKWLKIGVLVILVLAAMRAASWSISWLLRRVRVGARTSAVLGNLAGFALFAGLLGWNLLPGEPIDWDALLFGAIVFAVYGAVDWSRAGQAR